MIETPPDSQEQSRHTRACRGYLAESSKDVRTGRGEIAATKRGNDGMEAVATVFMREKLPKAERVRLSSDASDALEPPPDLTLAQHSSIADSTSDPVGVEVLEEGLRDLAAGLEAISYIGQRGSLLRLK